MTKTEIIAELNRLAPFFHDVALPHELRTFVPEKSRRSIERTRLRNFIRHGFPALLKACGGSLEGRRVLDVACNCGGFSFEAANLGARHVLGFDIVDHYLEQADFIKRALNANQVEFRKLDLESLDEKDIGQFDVTFCFGILYHLENPVLAMKRLSAVTREIMLVDTEVLTSRLVNRWIRRSVWEMNFPSVTDRDHESASTSLWQTEARVQFLPSARAVADLLGFLGFQNVEQIKPLEKNLGERYYEGRRVTFLAQR